MFYNPTDAELSVIKQKSKDYFVRIELLNKEFKIIDSLTGNIINDSLNVDSSSKQRRTYSVDLHVTDYSFLIGDDKKIWIDKYIRVYYGIKSVRTDETYWWLIGTFTYLDANYTYSGTENTLSLSCGDLMADYDGTKNGTIAGYSLTIPAGEDIRQSVLALVKAAGITNYNIEDIGKEIPYDLEYSDSITYCDVWTDICELYDSWEFFFDVDGTFVWRKIPTGKSESVILDTSFLRPIVVNESINNSFSEIYNVTEVWGQVIELELDDRYADSSTYSDNVYLINLEGIESLENIDNLDRIGIKISDNNLDGAMVSINGLEPIPIVNDDGSAIKADRLKGNTDYVFSYRRTLNGVIQNCLFLMGQYQAYGIYEETSKDCPFSTTNLGYKIVQRVNYENLYSDDLCYNQAQYLTYQTTALKDTINLSLLIIPWLDVNNKIEYRPNTTNESNQYIIKTLSWSTKDGTMSMTLYRFLESLSYVINQENEKTRTLERMF